MALRVRGCRPGAVRSAGFAPEERATTRDRRGNRSCHRRSPPQYRVVHLSDDPDELLPETLYGENGHLWHVILACPCGCSATIALDVLPDDSPRWRRRLGALPGDANPEVVASRSFVAGRWPWKRTAADVQSLLLEARLKVEAVLI